MTKNERILTSIGLGAAVVTAALVYSVRRARTRQMNRKLADEGYETAHDVLYPKRRKGYRVHYGPVLPS